MNKKGFIATSLLYSFFLLFCALIVVFIGNVVQKSLLLNKEIEKINEDLHSTKYLNDAVLGSHFRLNICISEDKKDYFNQADTLDYILFANNSTGAETNDPALLISKNYSFKLNSLELMDNILNSIYVKNGNNKIISRSMSRDDYLRMIDLDEDLKKLLLKSDFNTDSRYLLAFKYNNNYNNSSVYDMNTGTSRSLNSSDLTDEKTFVRLVFEIDNSTMIIGGDGTSSNPYILKGGASSC